MTVTVSHQETRSLYDTSLLQTGFPGADCMKRAAANAAGNFSVHDVQTEKFPTGPYTPHDWWKYLAKVHGQ